MTRLYHVTYPERLENILTEGLRIGSKRLLTDAGGWADEVYGDRPIYLSYEPWISNEGQAGMVLLSVDARGLELISDLPSLTDFGAYIEEGLGLYWEYGELPGDFVPYMDPSGEYVPFEVLLNEASKAAIEVTRTAACLQSIPADRIKQVKHWPRAERASHDRAIVINPATGKPTVITLPLLND